MSLLPEGYKRLLYIESTGTQYINTGVIPKSGTKASVDFRATATPTATWWILSAVTSGTVLWRAGVNSSGFRADGGFTYSGAQTPLDYAVATGTCTVNMSIPLYLCAQNEGGPVEFGKFKVYSCRISNGDTPVRNFVPCKTPAGEVGMYDTVNGVFCGNNGSGVFIAGPEFWYDELEYIESAGAQRIDTGFYPNQDTRVLMDADVPAVASGQFPALFFGDSAGSTQTRYGTMIYRGSDGFHDHYGNQVVNTSNIGVSGRHLFDKDKNVTYLDNVAVSNFSYSAFLSAVTLSLFCSYELGNYDYYATFKLYSCKVYDNGTLVRDFIPAKLPDGSIGLIDKLTEEFYPNMGTGVFTAGRLKPTKYMELEYIESTGTQYVDTGFIPNQDTRIVTNAKVLNVSGNNASGFLFGSGYPIQQNGFEAYAFSGAFSAVYNGVQVNGGSVSVGDVLLVDFNKNKCKVTRNGSDFYENTFTYTSFVSPVNLTLLMLPRQSKYYGVCELYSCQIYDNGNLVRDYIPIKLYDGTVGLLDKVSGLFYGNAGTGTFVAGPELYGLDENTVLLLHGEDIADSSDYHHSIANNGVTVSGGQSKFDGKSLYFNGSSYLQLNHIDFCNGTKDFTLDWWEYRIDSTSAGAVIYQNRIPGDGGNGLIAGYASSTPTFYLCSASGLWDIANAVSMGDMLTGRWVHRAVVRSGNNFYLFQNGVLKNTITSSAEVNNTGYIQIGSYYVSTCFKGYIDELRISNVARWTANFAVQNKPYSVIVKMPPVPADLDYSATDSTITLTWTGSEVAAGYNVYRNGELVATVTDTTYSEEIQPSIGYTYEVTAFNDFGETEPASVEVAPSAAPPAPANLRVMFADFASAQIAWDTSVGATAYRVYRDGEFLAETESRIFADSGLSKDTEYVYTVTAINVVGESSASSLTVKTSDFTLITDRTAADVEYALAQALNPDRNNTEWLKGLKGTYNATDLNRVEKAVEYVANRLEIAGWRRKPVVKIDWSFSDFPTVSEMQRYLDNIRLLRAALPEGMPAVPSDMNGFNYIEANTIEQILLLLDAAVTNIMLNIYYSNEKYSGEVK